MPAPEIVAHGWSRISLKLRAMMIGLVLVATALAVVVAVLVGGNGDESPGPILTSTTSTIIAAPVLTSTTSTVSVTSTVCFFFCQWGALSYAVILQSEHSPSSPRPPSRPRFGSNRVPPSSEMLLMTTWELRWISPRMPTLSWLELRILKTIQDTSKSTA